MAAAASPHVLYPVQELLTWLLQFFQECLFFSPECKSWTSNLQLAASIAAAAVILLGLLAAAFLRPSNVKTAGTAVMPHPHSALKVGMDEDPLAQILATVGSELKNWRSKLDGTHKEELLLLQDRNLQLKAESTEQAEHVSSLESQLQKFHHQLHEQGLAAKVKEDEIDSLRKELQGRTHELEVCKRKNKEARAANKEKQESINNLLKDQNTLRSLERKAADKSISPSSAVVNEILSILRVGAGIPLYIEPEASTK